MGYRFRAMRPNHPTAANLAAALYGQAESRRREGAGWDRWPIARPRRN